MGVDNINSFGSKKIVFRNLLSFKAITTTGRGGRGGQVLFTMFQFQVETDSFFMFGPPKESIFLTIFYGLYFQSSLHINYKLQFFMI